MNQSRRAFSMMELIFVIVIIGILSAVAVPKLAATRDDAEITKARTVVASVRNALAMERQKRILRGDFKKITAVGGNDNTVFGHFFTSNGDTGVDVMEYSIASEPNKKNRWSFNGGIYTFKSVLGDVGFIVNSHGKFV